MENNPQSPLSWDIDLARRMRGAGMSFTYIGAVFGVTAGTVHCRIDPEYRTRRRRQVYERRGPQTSIAAFINVASRVANVELEARLAEIPEDDRDFTARAFGDPVFARSAAALRPNTSVPRHGVTLPPVSILATPKQEGQPLALEPDPDEVDPWDEYEMGYRRSARSIASAIRSPERAGE